MSRRLRTSGQVARSISISIRYHDFNTVTRSAVLPTPSDVTGDLHTVAVRLYAKLPRKFGRHRIRRVGVIAHQLVPAEGTYRQPQLTDPERGWREIETAMDAAGEKFGAGAVQRLALVRPKQSPRAREAPSVQEVSAEPKGLRG